MERLAYLTSEAAPFAVSGGLGDVMGALPQAVARRAEGCRVSVILPLYGAVSDKDRARMRAVFHGEVTLAWRHIYFSVHALSHRGVEYCFIDQPQYFGRPMMYGEFDDGERFAFFARAALVFLLEGGRVPAVLHASDWQSALAVVYLRTLYADDERARGIRTVLTVHNIEYQGKYDPAILSDIFDLQSAHRHLLLHDGCLNLLAGGIRLADRVSTVSPRYAEEILDDGCSFGLSGVLASRGERPLGILNGIDGVAFNPRDGEALTFPYTARNAKEGKEKNKRAVLAELSLTGEEGAPLLIVISRLVAAKGVELLLATLRDILALGTTVVVLGSGERGLEEALSELAARHPHAMRVVLGFDRALSKRLYAGADILLMPSRSEPCGLAQMIACRYGTVPVVRATGGLADSIIPYGRSGGCGFVFREYRPEDFLLAVSDAVSLCKEGGKAWDRLVCTAMRTDFSWRRAAGEYLTLYRELTEEE